MGKLIGVNLSNQQFEAEDVEFINCNLTQSTPFRKQTFKRCKLKGCNLVNCDIDKNDNIIEDCNTTQREIKKENGKIITAFYDQKTRVVINIIEEDEE
ncbi:hypothetical protein LCGC14_2303710 [marine sediment metagenome]|uniref:Pentapeptide repeat protein n=1 Tax=marine sediment metagenome TaxID=412755 RepID=A0A0F9DA64_9ZZZZ